MESDIVIAGSMVLASVAALLAIIRLVAGAVREEPKLAPAPVQKPVVRPTQGW